MDSSWFRWDTSGHIFFDKNSFVTKWISNNHNSLCLNTSLSVPLTLKLKEPWGAAWKYALLWSSVACSTAKDRKDLSLFSKAWGSRFASEHNLLQSKMWPLAPPSHAPSTTLFKCLIKDCFLATHWSSLHAALARCPCHYNVTSVLQSESTNKVSVHIAVRTAGSSCYRLTSPGCWLLVMYILSVPSMSIINGKDYPRRFSSHK